MLASDKDRIEHDIVVRSTVRALEEMCEDVTLAPGERGVQSAIMDPAGRYAYKVAIDGSWDEAHGGGAGEPGVRWAARLAAEAGHAPGSSRVLFRPVRQASGLACRWTGQRI